MNINELMMQVNEWIKEILKDNYVGVYFHGSLRLGSFNPNKSDLDFIIVVKHKLSPEIKEQLWDKMLENEYKRLLHEGGYDGLIKIIKTTYLRNNDRINSKKKISEKDETYFNLAEKYLYNEFAVSLGISPEEAKEYVINKVNELSKV